MGWVLLALSVALVNASTGLTALYILLACVGWTLFLLLPVKMALFWLARKTGSSMFPFDLNYPSHAFISVESGPSVFFMTVTMMIVFGSAFFTDVIGVHAIFGVCAPFPFFILCLIAIVNRRVHRRTNCPPRRGAGNHYHRKARRYGLHNFSSTREQSSCLKFKIVYPCAYIQVFHTFRPFYRSHLAERWYTLLFLTMSSLILLQP